MVTESSIPTFPNEPLEGGGHIEYYWDGVCKRIKRIVPATDGFQIPVLADTDSNPTPCPHKLGYQRGCKFCGLSQDEVAEDLRKRAGQTVTLQKHCPFCGDTSRLLDRDQFGCGTMMNDPLNNRGSICQLTELRRSEGDMPKRVEVAAVWWD